MHPCYEASLAPFRSNPERVGPPETDWMTLSDGALRLSFHVSSEGEILEARHEGAAGDELAVLEAFCRFAVGLPLSEAREHGALRLEYRLRSSEHQTPVDGLVMAENADPAFAPLVRMLRQIPGDGTRFWSPPNSSDWKKLSVSDRHYRLLTAVQNELKNLGYGGPEVEVVPTSGVDRWLIGFGGESCPPDFFRLILSLEKRVRAATGTYVELFLEGKEDRNQRRARETRSHDLHPSA